MNTQIKNLFRLKPVNQPQNDNEVHEITAEENKEELRKRTYHEAGFRDSSRNVGSPKALSVCLNAIHAKFQNEEKESVEKQMKFKEPYVNEQNNKQTEIKVLAIKKENKQEQINKIDRDVRGVKDNIESIKFEINDLPGNPGKYHAVSTNGASAKFWVGMTILIPISLYLFTFYISTSYSAFFKKFDINTNLLMNVLDPKAFENAWNDGGLEGSFVTLIAFVFFGLGYLIHMFGENKNLTNYLKIGILFLTTFVFDSILAYQIEEKIYDLNKTFDSSPFNIPIAFGKIQFWGIIFAGFVVYIIWGVVFDFIMKENKEKDKIKYEQQKRKNDNLIYQERILDLEKQKDDFIQELNDIKELIAKTEGRVIELQKIIDAVIIPTKEYVLCASEYVQGWVTHIFEKLFASRAETQSLATECIETYNVHLEEVGSKEDSQNSIYLSVL